MIKRANAFYTGGGIYVFVSEKENGEYTISDSESLEYVLYVSEDPIENFDNAFNPSWQQENFIDDIVEDMAFIENYKILKWIIENQPDNGNYLITELERIMERLKQESTIDFSEKLYQVFDTGIVYTLSELKNHFESFRYDSKYDSFEEYFDEMLLNGKQRASGFIEIEV